MRRYHCLTEGVLGMFWAVLFVSHALAQPSNPCKPVFGSWVLKKEPVFSVRFTDAPQAVFVENQVSVSMEAFTEALGFSERSDQKCGAHESRTLTPTFTYSWKVQNGTPSAGVGSTATFKPLTVGESVVTFTVTATFDPPAKSKSQEYSHRITVAQVNLVDVDASNPQATLVNYEAVPGSVKMDIIFDAPGKKGEVRNGVSGKWSCTYSQDHLFEGKNTIQITAKVDKYSSTLKLDADYVRKVSKGVEIALGGVFSDDAYTQVPLNHELTEIYDTVSYSCPLKAGSKTLKLRSSQASVQQPQTLLLGNIMGYVENHYYIYDGKEMLFSEMKPPATASIQPQGYYYVESFSSEWFERGKGLTGYSSIVSIFFDQGRDGLISWVAEANATIDCALE